MEINEENYQKIGESDRLIEMGQSNLNLEGALVRKTIIEAEFGTTEIDNTRKQQTILHSSEMGFRVYREISRVNIIKSFKPKEYRKGQDKKAEENNSQNQIARKQIEQSDQIFYEESEHVESTKKKLIRKNRRKINERKQLKKKLNEINKKIEK